MYLSLSSSAADKDDRQHLRGHHLREEHQLELRLGPAGPHHRQPGAVGAQRQLGLQAAGRQGQRPRLSTPQSKRSLHARLREHARVFYVVVRRWHLKLMHSYGLRPRPPMVATRILGGLQKLC